MAHSAVITSSRNHSELSSQGKIAWLLKETEMNSARRSLLLDQTRKSVPHIKSNCFQPIAQLRECYRVARSGSCLWYRVDELDRICYRTLIARYHIVRSTSKHFKSNCPQPIALLRECYRVAINGSCSCYHIDELVRICSQTLIARSHGARSTSRVASRSYSWR